MNELSSPISFGFVPFEKLSLLNITTPPEEYQFLLNVEELDHEVDSFRDKQNLSQQIDERVSLLAQAAVITGRKKYIKVGHQIRKKYAKFSDPHEILKIASAILRNQFIKNWIAGFGTIALLWQKSRTFLKISKEHISESDSAFLKTPHLLTTNHIILSAIKAYQIYEKTNHLLSHWHSVLHYEYGMLNPMEVADLGSLDSKNKSYTKLLDCSCLVKLLEEPNDANIFHLSRRVIALAAAALFTFKQKYFVTADSILKAIKVETSKSGDVRYCAKFLSTAQKLAKEKNFAQWKIKWLTFNELEKLESNPIIIANKLDLSVLKNNNLDSAIDKYLLIKKIEKLLGFKKVSFEDVSETEPQFAKISLHKEIESNKPKNIGRKSQRLVNPVETSKSVCRTNSSPRSEILAKGEAIDTEKDYSVEPSFVPSDDPQFKDNSTYWDWDTRLWDQKETVKKEKSVSEQFLKRWLQVNAPEVLDRYKSVGIHGPLYFFVKTNYKKLLKEFSKSQDEDICYCSELCIFHSSDAPKYIPRPVNEFFLQYKLALKSPETLYACWQYFLDNHLQIAVSYLKNKTHFNLLRFLFHTHPHKLNYFFEKYAKHTYIKRFKSFAISKLQKKDEVEKLEEVKFDPKSLSKRKQYLFLLHSNSEIQILFRLSLEHFAKQLFGGIDEELAETLFYNAISLLESRKKKVREEMVEILELLNSIQNFSNLEEYYSQSEILFDSYLFFLKNDSDIIKNFITDEVYFNFLRYAKANYEIKLKIFFIDKYLTKLKMVVSEICKKPFRELDCDTNNQFEITNLSTLPFIRAKQYVHILQTDLRVQRKLMQHLPEFTSTLKFDISEKEALFLKKYDTQIVKIGSSVYRIDSINRTRSVIYRWNIKLLLYNSNRISIHSCDLTESEEINKHLKQSQNLRFTISNECGEFLKRESKEVEIFYIKSNDQIYKVLSLERYKKEFKSKYVLKATFLYELEQAEDFYELKNASLIPQNHLSFISALQSPVIKSRKAATAQMDDFNAKHLELFKVE